MIGFSRMDKRRDAFETEVRPDRLPVRRETKLTCRRMTNQSRADAFQLLEEFLARDEHYLKSRQNRGGNRHGTPDGFKGRIEAAGFAESTRACTKIMYGLVEST
jgi:hypothetical protein